MIGIPKGYQQNTNYLLTKKKDGFYIRYILLIILTNIRLFVSNKYRIFQQELSNFVKLISAGRNYYVPHS